MNHCLQRNAGKIRPRLSSPAFYEPSNPSENDLSSNVNYRRCGRRNWALFISVFCLLNVDNLIPQSYGWTSKYPHHAQTRRYSIDDIRFFSQRQKLPALCVAAEPQSMSSTSNMDRNVAVHDAQHSSESSRQGPSGKNASSSPRNMRQKTTHRRNHKKYRNGKGSGSHIKSMFQEAKKLERQGLWNEAITSYRSILDKAPTDAHSHLALARLEARRETKSRRRTTPSSEQEKFPATKAHDAFEKGTGLCPDSVHLWQAWAVYEESRGNIHQAQVLFEKALTKEPQNPYVCHAFGLYYKRLGDAPRAMELFHVALESQSTAALVCSLGEMLVQQKELDKARALYSAHIGRLKKEKDQIEVYLAWAWLEERYFRDFQRANELLGLALKLNPNNSLANVALARLEGRMNSERSEDSHSATVKRLAEACSMIENSKRRLSNENDGRVFNALAQMEVKAKNLKNARKVLKRGMKMFPLDHNLFQAAGKVEERLGNYVSARRLYGQSLSLEPSAPCLVAYAILEYRHPKNRTDVDIRRVCGLFEEAILLDPRHGPAYNAYGNIQFQSGNIDQARAVFERGVEADCSDVASLYHGYGKLELSLGNVESARTILERGLEQVRLKDVMTDSTHRERSKFLFHTLGMLELNSNRPSVALEIFKDGLERCGNSSHLLLGAGLSEMKLGKDEAARELFERSATMDKNHAQAWQAWGVMETKAGNFNTAATLFQCGIQKSSTHGALWHGYASLEIKRDNIHNARVLFAAGLQKTPNHIPLYQGWALLELREGNYQDAKKLITEALTRNKKNGSGWLIAAQIEEAQGNAGLVSLLLRRGIECAPTDPELYRKLGDYLVNRGQLNDAREVYETGMEFNPLHAPLYHSLAELEARVFNLEALAKLNKRAAELFHNNAMEPPKASSQAYATKIRNKNALPPGIAALTEKIVDDDAELMKSIDSIDPSYTLDALSGSLLEDEFVGGLVSIGNFPKTQ